jgi:hypothetical protein
MSKEEKHTYYRIDFINCSIDNDYIIVKSIGQVLDWLCELESDFDDPDLDASVQISGIAMTKKEFEDLKKTTQDE